MRDSTKIFHAFFLLAKFFNHSLIILVIRNDFVSLGEIVELLAYLVRAAARPFLVSRNFINSNYPIFVFIRNKKNKFKQALFGLLLLQ